MEILENNARQEVQEVVYPVPSTDNNNTVIKETNIASCILCGCNSDTITYRAKSVCQSCISVIRSHSKL